MQNTSVKMSQKLHYSTLCCNIYSRLEINCTVHTADKYTLFINRWSMPTNPCVIRIVAKQPIQNISNTKQFTLFFIFVFFKLKYNDAFRNIYFIKSLCVFLYCTMYSVRKYINWWSSDTQTLYPALASLYALSPCPLSQRLSQLYAIIFLTERKCSYLYFLNYITS